MSGHLVAVEEEKTVNRRISFESGGQDSGGPLKLLSVFSDEEDSASVERIVAPSRWTVLQANGCRQARGLVHLHKIAVVLCDQTLPDGSWRDVLRDLAGLANAPILVVASSLADEALWAEVLNLGAYDLLSKPFRADEVLRTISLAPRLSLAAAT
jgi:two-component system response regulator AtoC